MFHVSLLLNTSKREEEERRDRTENFSNLCHGARNIAKNMSYPLGGLLFPLISSPFILPIKDIIKPQFEVAQKTFHRGCSIRWQMEASKTSAAI
ncbi:uncharacterized protein V6R79_015336 [Siganus canaliculatus]